MTNHAAPPVKAPIHRAVTGGIETVVISLFTGILLLRTILLNWGLFFCYTQPDKNVCLYVGRVFCLWEVGLVSCVALQVFQDRLCEAGYLEVLIEKVEQEVRTNSQPS